jgi:hypothetical protein
MLIGAMAGYNLALGLGFSLTPESMIKNRECGEFWSRLIEKSKRRKISNECRSHRSLLCKLKRGNLKEN